MFSISVHHFQSLAITFPAYVFQKPCLYGLVFRKKLSLWPGFQKKTMSLYLGFQKETMSLCPGFQKETVSLCPGFKKETMSLMRWFLERKSESTKIREKELYKVHLDMI